MNNLIEKTLEFWKKKFSYAEYDSDGKTFKVPLTNVELDKDNSCLIVDFNINDEIDSDASITRVAWYDDNSDLLDESEENIIRESYIEGILYRYKIFLRRVS